MTHVDQITNVVPSVGDNGDGHFERPALSQRSDHVLGDPVTDFDARLEESSLRESCEASLDAHLRQCLP